MRWPWWTVATACTGAKEQQWVYGANQTLAMPHITSGCWPGHGGAAPTDACCLTAEGGNPELTQCGWMTDAVRQQVIEKEKGEKINLKKKKKGKIFPI